MAPRLYQKKHRAGLPPGTLLSADETKKIQSVITLMDYSGDKFQERILQDVEECFNFKNTDTVTWINVDGRDVDVIKKIDSHFEIHPLVLEDVLNSGQRPKLEDYGQYFFLVLKMIHQDKQKDDFFPEQISLVVGKNFVISFQEEIPGDIFDGLRQRIRDGKGRIRQMGADYLAYCLVDAVVDHYFVMLENMGEKIDQMEQYLFANPPEDFMKTLHHMKKQVMFLRKNIWPLRDVINALIREEAQLVAPETRVFFRDAYDHVTRVNETLENFREALSGMHDIYLSHLSNRMNEIMKFLTVFTSIFIPLTFIVGIYGMNFDNMPELHWHYGYFVVLFIMFLITAIMVIYFRKKRWL